MNAEIYPEFDDDHSPNPRFIGLVECEADPNEFDDDDFSPNHDPRFNHHE